MDVYVVVVAVLLFLYLLKRSKSELNFPGPKGLPYLGNVLQVKEVNGSKNLIWTVIDSAKQYGPIFKFKMLGEEIVVVSNYDAIYEILVKKSTEFAGRPNMYRFNKLNEDNGIALIDYNDTFKVNKKVAQQGLKQYGDGMTRIERLAQEEIEKLTETFEKQKEKAFDPRDSVQHLVLRIIESLAVGEHLSEDDSDSYKSMAWLTLVMEDVLDGNSGIILDLFPWVRYFGNKAYRAIDGYKKIAYPLWTDWIQRCRTKQKLGEIECNTLLETLIEEEEAGTVSRTAIFAILQNAFGAGVTTTYVTTSSFLILMLNYPDYQKRLYEEVQEVLGDRMPELSDKDKMPLMEATILEVLRYSSIVPLNVPHKAMCDTTVMGQHIPKGTQVWANLWAMHHDECYFDKPYEFNPTRFLDNHGCVLRAEERKSFLPFGAGRRVCLGEVLAKTRLFLILTRLVQKFEFLPEVPHRIPSSDMKTFVGNIAFLPPEFKLIAKLRF